MQNPSFPAGYKTAYPYLQSPNIKRKITQKVLLAPSEIPNETTFIFTHSVSLNYEAIQHDRLHQAGTLHHWFGCANLNCPSGFKWPILWMHYFMQLDLDVPQWWGESSLYLFQAMNIWPSHSPSVLYRPSQSISIILIPLPCPQISIHRATCRSPWRSEDSPTLSKFQNQVLQYLLL